MDIKQELHAHYPGFREGQPLAVAVTLRLLRKILLPFALKRQSVCDAEEAVSDILLVVYQRRDTFNDAAGMRRYACGCIVNRQINAWKKEQVRKRNDTAYRALADTAEVPPETSPYETDLVLARAYELAQYLPASARRVFELTYFLGLTATEIAALLGTSTKTIYNQKRLGELKIRDELARENRIPPELAAKIGRLALFNNLNKPPRRPKYRGP